MLRSGTRCDRMVAQGGPRDKSFQDSARGKPSGVLESLAARVGCGVPRLVHLARVYYQHIDGDCRNTLQERTAQTLHLKLLV